MKIVWYESCSMKKEFVNRIWAPKESIRQSILNIKERKAIQLMKRNSLAQFGIVGLMLTGIFLAQIPAALAIENGGYPNERFLVSTQWLAARLNDPNIRILDRQDIFPKDNFYAVGHIPNSIRMPTSAIKGTKDGIEEMLIVKDLLTFLDKNGISDKNHIILVGRSEREPATTRVFWTLEMLGHKEISVLDGGIDKMEG